MRPSVRILIPFLSTSLCLIAFWWHIPSLAAPPLADDTFWSSGFHSLERGPRPQRWTSDRSTLYLPVQTTGAQRLVLWLQSGRSGPEHAATVQVQVATDHSSTHFVVAQAPRLYQLLLPNRSPLYLLRVTLVAPPMRSAKQPGTFGIVVTGAASYALRNGTPWWAITSVLLLIQYALLWLLTRRQALLLRGGVLTLWLPTLLPWLWTHGYDSRGAVVLSAATVGVLLPYTLARLGSARATQRAACTAWQRLQPYQAALCHAALLLPLLLYCAIAWNWNHDSTLTLTGDEPHYMLIAASLARDHDAALENNYRQDAIDHQFAAQGLDDAGQVLRTSHGWFSIHSVGLPLLLALPLRLAGVLGAKLALAMLIGLFPLIIFRTLRRILVSQSSALPATLAIALSLPFLAGSNQIYPDMLAGVLIYWIVELLLDDLPSSALNGRTSWLVTSLIACLPWLHIKHVAPALILTAWYITIYVSRRACLRWIAPLTLIVISLFMLGCYNRYAFGSIFGPYSSPLIYNPQYFSMILLGLHFDQAQGMFIQQPFLFIALLGIILFWKDNPRRAALIGLLYLTLILPNAMLPNWYGGVSFAGRFAWNSVLLWIFPLAYALKALRQRSDTAIITISIFSVALQAYIALLWLPDNYYRRLYNPMLLNNAYTIWNFQPSYLDLSALLPAFSDFSTYTWLLPNYGVLALCCLLIWCGSLLHRAIDH